MKRRLVVGITGASGAIYGIRLLEILKEVDTLETHVVVSRSAQITLAYETSYCMKDIENLASAIYDNEDVGAAIASGSFRTVGMIVAPCSVKTLSGIANCYAENLILRAADVALKERRKVVLLFRETPLHLGHLRIMRAATEAGAILFPPVPGFYGLPQSLADVIDQSIGRMLDVMGIETTLVVPWIGDKRSPADT